MDRFEYVMVMVSIIIGLAFVHLLQGLAEVAQRPRPFRLRSIHLVWVLFMLVTVAFFWWWQFKLQALQEWTFGTYIFELAFACVMYFQSTLLFPKDLGPDVDLDEFFHQQRGWFFGVNALGQLLDLVDTWIKGSEHFQSLGPEYPIGVAFNVIGSLIAIFVPARAFQWVFALASLLYVLSWALRQFNTLA
ncbi:MAG: hypothetical protein WCJ52_05680 [Phenylobacterium sp.]|uniref:hypothetical protein n=1 Tax=Phenylobacterium sp. TaxID=1871053 RepID=UPI00301A45B5